MADAQSGSTGGRTIGIILSPTSVRIAQTLGMTLSSYSVGQMLSSSFSTVPAILRFPSPVLLQEGRRLARGNNIPRALALGAGTAAAWLAYREPTSTTQAFMLYATGAGMMYASSLWSSIAVGAVELDVARRAEAELSGTQTQDLQLPMQKEELMGVQGLFRRWSGTANDLFFPILRNGQLSAHELVDRWALLNVVAAGLMGVGAVCTTWAVVSGDTSIFELFQMAAAAEE